MRSIYIKYYLYELLPNGNNAGMCALVKYSKNINFNKYKTEQLNL